MDSIISIDKVSKLANSIFHNLGGQAFENKYEIGKLIKKNKIDEFYEVIYKPLKQEMMLMKVKQEGAVKKDMKQFFYQSIIMQKIDHPYVINLFEKVEDSKYLYLVFERLKG